MRQRIGKSTSLVTRELIYQADDGFDVEMREHYEVVQRRVLYDDVQLVTYHREFGSVYFGVTGSVAAVFCIPAIGFAMLGSDAAIGGAIALALFGVPALLAFLIRLLWRVDVITIFGRRSKASLRFSFRKRKARETYGKICAIVRQAQGRGRTPAPPIDGADAIASAADDAGVS
jgi:hypothetical protein